MAVERIVGALGNKTAFITEPVAYPICRAGVTTVVVVVLAFGHIAVVIAKAIAGPARGTFADITHTVTVIPVAQGRNHAKIVAHAVAHHSLQTSKIAHVIVCAVSTVPIAFLVPADYITIVVTNIP